MPSSGNASARETSTEMDRYKADEPQLDTDVSNSETASSITVSEAPQRQASHHDLEAQDPTIKHPSHFKLVFDQTLVTSEVLNYPYRGSGTKSDPFVVEYIPNDPRNPMLFRKWVKWAITLLVATVSGNLQHWVQSLQHRLSDS